MSKRLVVCCDGTWNTPDEMRGNQDLCTNIAKLALAVANVDGQGREQRMFYDTGVGTAGNLDRLAGGVFGYGLSHKVQDAYKFVVENFDPGDDLFIFGFSRGAYTARSTAGLIRSAGVLRRQSARQLHTAYELYRDRSNTLAPRTREATLFRRSHSHETRIKFIGVWDTVGALGIPKLVDFSLPVRLPLPALSNHWDFHDVTLSSYVDYAYHALALDERRKPFTPTLWNQQTDLKLPQVLEQVWFSGVHSNVGGGYPDSGLSDVTLWWMLAKARACGLAFDEEIIASTIAPDPLGTLYTSMAWPYDRLGEEPRDIPPVRRDADGNVMITNEWVASTARLRSDMDATYRPPNLIAFLKRGGPIMEIAGWPNP